MQRRLSVWSLTAGLGYVSLKDALKNASPRHENFGIGVLTYPLISAYK